MPELCKTLIDNRLLARQLSAALQKYSRHYSVLIYSQSPCFFHSCSSFPRKTATIKGIVHPKMKIGLKYPHPQVQEIDEFVSSSDLEKCSIPSLAHQWILCSEWVPSEWESKQLIKTTVIHTTPVHQFTSCKVKSCMFVRNKPIIKMFLTSNCCFWLKYESSIHNITYYPENNSPHLNQERNMHRSSTVYKWK